MVKRAIIQTGKADIRNAFEIGVFGAAKRRRKRPISQTC